jgi:hypothetical protein
VPQIDPKTGGSIWWDPREADWSTMGLLRELGWPFRGETPQKVA